MSTEADRQSLKLSAVTHVVGLTVKRLLFVQNGLRVMRLTVFLQLIFDSVRQQGLRESGVRIWRWGHSGDHNSVGLRGEYSV